MAVSSTFEVLAEPARRQIVALLADGEMPVGEIASQFNSTISAVSQHLKVLRDSGFATVRIDGARRIYAIDAGPMQEVDAWLERFRMFWGVRLEALATEVARGKKRRGKDGG